MYVVADDGLQPSSVNASSARRGRRESMADLVGESVPGDRALRGRFAASGRPGELAQRRVVVDDVLDDVECDHQKVPR
jgi:hypothetical protein